MGKQERWENYLNSIQTVVQYLKEEEPTEDELQEIAKIDEQLFSMLQYIEDGRP